MINAKHLVMSVLFLLVASAAAYGQEQICISQEAANKCADNVNVIAQQKAEIDALKTALINRDKIIEDLKVKVAVEAQKAVDNEKAIVRMTAILEAMLKSYTKPKKWGLIVF